MKKYSLITLLIATFLLSGIIFALFSYKYAGHSGTIVYETDNALLNVEYEQTANLLLTPEDASLPDSVGKRFDEVRKNAVSLLKAIGDLQLSAVKQAEVDQYRKRLNDLALLLAGNQWSEKEEQTFAVLKKEVILSNPLLKSQPFVFVTRRQYAGEHHNTATFFPSAKNEHNDGKFNPGGALKLIDFPTGRVTTLLNAEEGVIRDPEVHFDAKKILFSMRRNFEDSYHLYEINTDGTGLRQLTYMNNVDDLDPFYLADDHIAFTSTREPKYCMCNKHIMANLYRMEPDGSNIYQISKNPLFDGHGSLTPDGRILYDRWEYVDRNFGDAQSLWTSNPDGTNHALYWGNNTPSPGAVIDARIIPGTTGKVVCVFGSCHDRPWGAIAVVDRRIGMDGAKPVDHIWPESAMQYVWESDYSPYYGIDNMGRIEQKFEDPYPLNDKYFICAGQIKDDRERTGLYLLDIYGNELLLYEDSLGCYDPAPVATRQRPPVIPSRRNLTDSVGFFYVQDVYEGTHMEGVKRGEVKYLRVIETPEKRFWTRQGWSGQGVILPAMNWHDFNNKKILGTVPVDEDGSAYFEVPSEKFVFFQLLDKDGMMIQSMRSGTMVQPGEQNGCIGCHDDRRATASREKHRTAFAFAGKPHRPEPWQGKTDEFSYREEVQPVFDRLCLQCHQPGAKAGKTLDLSGGTAQVFNTSYSELWRKQYISAIGAGPAQTMPARSWGASASKLITVLKNGHAGIQIDSLSMDKLITWIDLNAPYYPSYATSYPDNPFGRSPLTRKETNRLKELTGINITLPEAASYAINFDEPAKSQALKDLKDVKKYEEAIQIISAGSERIRQSGVNDLAGFKSCPVDQWREEKYLAHRNIEQENRKSILAGEKRFDIAVGN
ncbi:MAG: hypothetical protein LBT50_07510 [Prevotellaceae bacterium]|jgi:hypothetical protein|nr:hypothetical protein [Prevotellaceae bacterium]